MEDKIITIEQKAIKLLESYSGANNYIIKLKNQKEKNKNFYPTRSQSDYIINYSETQPKVAKKWVELDPYFAKKIANTDDYKQYFKEKPRPTCLQTEIDDFFSAEKQTRLDSF